jgi:putative methionine-R-sulfoxide reductase with GAF domain
MSEINIQDAIYSACFDENENIWLGTDKGIAFYEPGVNKITYYPNSFDGTDTENRSFNQSFPVFGIGMGSNGLVWMACLKYGLFSFDRNTKKFQDHRQPSGLAYETLNRCSGVIVSQDTIWVSSMAGLSAYIPQEKNFINYNIANGLASTYVYSIAKHPDGSVWGRGNTGVFRFVPSSGKFINYRLPASFDLLYYMQTVNIHHNDCLLGLENEIAVFSPAGIPGNDFKVHITACRVNDERVLLQEGAASFTHVQNNIQFDFTTPNFNNSSQTFYYMLEGLNDDWVESASKTNVLFTHLPPARYIFKVKIKNNTTGNFSNTAAQAFIIHAAFWQETWFKAAVLIGAALLLFGGFYWRIRNINNINAEKEKVQSLTLNQYQKQLELEKIISFFSASLVEKNNIDEVLGDVCSHLISKLGFEDCMIYLWNTDKTILLQKAGYGQKGSMQFVPEKEKYHVMIGQGIIGASAELKTPLLVNDTSSDPRYRTADGIIRLSEVCVPINKDEEQIGMINLEATQKNAFTAWHVQMLSTIAALIASKIKAIETTSELHQKQLELVHASNRLTATELSLLRSQMNPHFIFNSLNSVQKYIWENKEEDAAEYLSSFARLMRAILENSRHEYISVKEEMEIIKLYIDLEHRRSNHHFDYLVKIDEQIDLDNTMIPPLLMQPFIENAIWHGLNKKKGKGNLRVAISKKEDQLVCEVEDDGTGRAAAETKPAAEKKSLGISITQQRIEKLVDNAGKNASVTIKDKWEHGLPAGTKVIVILPLQIRRHA